jgi:Flp pilus assembly protein TadD
MIVRHAARSAPLGWSLAFVLVLQSFSLAARADALQDIEQSLRSGQTEQALSQADAAIATNPRAAQARFLKGVILSDLGRTDQAIDVFVALTQDFPELPDPYNNLAVLYAAQGQLEPALAALRQALRNDPQHLAARENLGDVHLALAVQAWNMADTQAGRTDSADLKRKLRLARQIIATPNTATAQRTPG